MFLFLFPFFSFLSAPSLPMNVIQDRTGDSLNFTIRWEKPTTLNGPEDSIVYEVCDVERKEKRERCKNKNEKRGEEDIFLVRRKAQERSSTF